MKIGVLVEENYDYFTSLILNELESKISNCDIILIKLINSSNSRKQIKKRSLFAKVIFRLSLLCEMLFLLITKRKYVYKNRFTKKKYKSIKVETNYQKGNKRFLSTPDYYNLKNNNFDYVIRCCNGILLGHFLDICKNGIISYHHGNHKEFKGGPAGFWEVMQKSNSTGFMIQIINDKLDSGKILFTGELQTKPLYLLNQYYLFRLSSKYITKVILNFSNLKDNVIDTDLFVTRKIYRLPGSKSSLIYFGMVITYISKYFFNKILKKSDNWNVHFNLNIKNKFFLHTYDTFKIDYKKIFIADPFIHKLGNSDPLIFVEEFNKKSKKGHISVYNPILNEKVNDCLIKKTHLSFPFILEHNDDIYMIPESVETKSIDMYKCIKYPEVWDFHSTLINNIKAVDSIVFYKNDYWFLICNTDESELSEFTHEMSIYYKKDLFDGNEPWHPHLQNPVKVSSLGSRNAGLFQEDNNIFRCGQVQGFDKYGKGLIIFQIIEITPTKYIEKKIDELEIDLNDGRRNIHHLFIKYGMSVFDSNI